MSKVMPEIFPDLEHVVTNWAPSAVGAYTVHSPSRCKECWGGLMGRGPAPGEFSEIRCRVCGINVQGKEATEEYRRISEEAQENALRMRCGDDPEYGEGPFLQKAIIVEEILSKAELKDRVAKKLRKNRRNKQVLTRSTFPLGAPGNLYMQAKILISGVRDVYSVHGTSMTEHEIVDLEDGGFKLDLTKSSGKMVQDPQYQEFKMMSRLGCQMSAAILAAFACELVMKAISLTCKDEASRTHDLLDLYQDLPEDSRRRVAVDYEAIADVMEEGRHIFGRWRYFENNAGPEALRGMVDLGRTLRLAKAARVLLDEAMLVGLYGGAKMNAREKVRVEGPTEEYEQEVKLTIKAGESPRRKAEPLPDRWTTVKSTRSEIDKCKKRGQPSVLSWSATRDKRQFDLTVSAGDSQRAAEEGPLPRSSKVDSLYSKTGKANKPED